MDVIWFRLPRRTADPHEVGSIHIGQGGFCVVLERERDWQLGFIFPKGSYQVIRAAGLEDLRRRVAAVVPWIADRLAELRDWRQAVLLSVESSCLPRWYRPGVLLIGDAAHVMSPVGGVGINYAVQDAVETANLLARPLHAGRVGLHHLRAVQLRRERPARFCQAIQGLIQRRIVGQALAQEDQPFQLPLPLRLLLRLPLLRNLPAHFLAYGWRKVHVES
jgi:2-polyprenyl-6-methoxyphenol hydroxylase-like FAD-dependent oxidoreductase